MKHLIVLLIGITFLATILSTHFEPQTTSAQDGGGVSVPISLDHPYAPFLESRAYAASVGATAEFRKMEWVTIDYENNRLYMAMSLINQGMSDGAGDIQLDENLCGIVYMADLDDNMDISELVPAVVGGPYDEANALNKCDVNNIAEPDGVAIDARGRVWIAEDTSGHENNMVWVFDPNDGSLKRFGYVPLGAEVTGVHVTANGTLFLNYQHPASSNIEPFNASGIGVVNGFNANTDDFEPITMPEGEAKQMVGIAAGEYQILGRAGKAIPNAPDDMEFGQIINGDGETVSACHNTDGNMYLPTNTAGTEGILYTNFECRPGGVSRLNIQQEADGTWTVLSGEMVNFGSVKGTWNNCGSSVSPWNTALSAEESAPGAGDLNNVANMNEYVGGQANPYDYGWVVEITPNADGNAVSKRYAWGRKSNESGVVASDLRTVYFGDDGTNVVVFKFVADEASNMSAGTLYGAKVTQVGGPGGDHSFQIEWIELGHGNDSDIEAAIRELDAALQ